jgi:hypothetical protein
MGEMGIVEWGRVRFALLDAGEISMDALVASVPPGCGRNDFAVLGCFCEAHLERTLALHREVEAREARELAKADEAELSLSLVGMSCVSSLRILLTLDRHFQSGTRFVDAGFTAWLTEWREREDSFRHGCYVALCRFPVSSEDSACIQRAIERIR